jgi:hypothetical protein
MHPLDIKSVLKTKIKVNAHLSLNTAFRSTTPSIVVVKNYAKTVASS